MTDDRDQSKGTTLSDALRWLKEHNRYILDTGSFRPRWGIPGEVPQAQPVGIWRKR